MIPARICLLITELAPAGAERCVYELACRLDRRRFRPYVACLRGGRYAEALAEAGVPTAILGMTGKADAMRLGRLPSLLRRWRVDLLHTHLFHADLAGRPAALAAGVRRVVHTVHVAEGRWRPWQFAFARLADPWCDRIVCVSQAVAEHHAARTHLPRERYAVIPNGVDLRAFARNEDARRRLRRRWGLAEGQTAVAFLGRLDPQKGLDVLLDAGDILAERREDLRIVIAGHGPQRGMLAEALARRPVGRLARHLGFVDDPAGLLSAADILAMPSRWEGLPLAGVEAMAAGLPIVGTRAPGVSEIVEDRRTGLLVPPGDARALAAGIERLTDEPAEARRLGRAGLDRVRQRYSIEANVAAHEALYADVLAGR